MGILYVDPQTGWELPVQGGVVTQGYGPENTDPSVRHLYRKGYHTGIDIGGVALDAAVVSPRDGAVSLADVNGGYGNCVIIDCEDGVQVLFGHLNSIAVAAGQPVFAGQRIGGVGTTGVSTGVHLHYEWRRGAEDIDPVPSLTPAAPRASWTAVVKEPLNLRSGPTKNDPILVTVEAGSMVNIGQEGWVPVWYEGRQGWMFAEFLELQVEPARRTRRGSQR